MTASASVTEPMAAFMSGHPGLKYVFFGGKGGVGKTVMAGATAVWGAEAGKRTLLASTNPVHSLSGLLDQDVFGRHTPVRGVSNLFAYEIDTHETIERSKREIRENVHWFHEFGIPVGGVIVNMRIDESMVGPESAEFARNRLAMQDEHMQTIWDKFDGQVRAIVPLFETEVRGADTLRRVAQALF